MIVSCVPDLLMRSKIDIAARHYGVDLAHGATVEQARALLGRHSQTVRLVLVDLDLHDQPTVDLVAEARRTTTARVVAFCSHVHTDLIRAGREAGAHTVMANSTFASGVAGLVAALASGAFDDPQSPPTINQGTPHGNV